MALPQFFIDFTEVYNILRPLMLFVGGMAVYSIFIFKFYRFLAAKDIFTVDFERHNRARLKTIRKAITGIFYVLKFLIVFPLFAFIWFVVLAILLVVTGVQLVTLGLLGEMLARTYHESQGKPIYVLAEDLGARQKSDGQGRARIAAAR